MNDVPALAVIIPTSKPLEAVVETLASLETQADSEFETVIVQNGVAADASLDVDIAERFDRLRPRLVHESIPGLLAGRHRGVRETNAEWLAFVDDDIVFGSDWSAGIRSAFADSSVSLVGGPSEPLYATPPSDWIEEFWSTGNGIRSCSMLSLMDAGERRRTIDPQHVWGLNFAIRRRALMDAGGFHPDGVPWELRRFRGDGETGLCGELSRLGLDAVYEPRTLVRHRVSADRLTLDYFVRRAFLQGISDSYTAIRRNGRPDAADKSAHRSWRSVVAGVRQRIPGLRTGDDVSSPMRQVRDAAIRGYEYHQTEVAADPKLLAWVTRPNYWDYSYPES